MCSKFNICTEIECFLLSTMNSEYIHISHAEDTMILLETCIVYIW